MIHRVYNAVEFAKSLGADEAEVIYDYVSFVKTSCRLGKPETTEISRSDEMGIRLIRNQRQIFLSLTDFSTKSIEKLVKEGLEMLKYLPLDPFAKLIDADFISVDLQSLQENNDFCDSKVLSPEEMMHLSLATEDSALSVEGITNSDGASASRSLFGRLIMSSNGFKGKYRKSSFSLGVSVIAGTGDQMKTDYEYDSSLFFDDLGNPKEIGEKAAKRTLEKLGAKKIQTGTMPVVFDRRAGKGIFGSFLSAINGRYIAQNISFLKDDLQKTIFPKNLSLIDIPKLPRGKASRPFDDEGILGKNLEIIQEGVLKSWILDYSCASKLGLATTGHASRSLTGPSSPRVTNIEFKGEFSTLNDLIRDIPSGFYVTDLMGEGGNPLTGNFSSGATGFLIENGKITSPIHEATIAGNLRDMFQSVSLANDFENKGGLNSPSFMIPKLTVGGI